MQITTTKENLASPLSLVMGAADTRGTVPILGTVLMKATDKGQLSLLCSDTGLLARTLTPCEVAKTGSIAIDVRRFNDLIKAVPDKQPIEISVEAKGNTLLVKSGRSRFRLPALAASDYPQMLPAKEERLSITIGARRLADMISDITASMADADLRPFLNGALFSLDREGLWLVSTDGHRMSISHEPIVGSDTLVPRNVIIPRKTVLLAKKLLLQGGSVTLTLGSKNVQFLFADGAVLLGNAVDGTYPNWRSVIPATTERVTISAERLSNSLAMIDVVAESETPMLAMAASAKKKGEEDKVFGALAKQQDEDPTILV